MIYSEIMMNSVLYLMVINPGGSGSPMCKINAFNTQTVKALILHIGGSSWITLWIPGHQRGYTGISVYLKYSTD